MKVFNIKSNGNLTFNVNDQKTYSCEVTNPAFSVDHQNELNSLLSSIQSEGLQEMHIEQTDFKSFVHKVKNEEVLMSDNVNSFEVFVNLESYVTDLENYETLDTE
jgi:hypothetical protein